MFPHADKATIDPPRPPRLPPKGTQPVNMSDDNVYEYLGLTYGQNSNHLAVNVTATGQNTTETAYVLEGLTNIGYSYKAEVLWCDTICPGFEGNLNLWEANGTNRLYATQKWPLAADHDNVLLSLNFTTGGNIDMRTKDWRTNENLTFTMSAYGANTFIGLNANTADNNGYFSGLETWQHFSAPSASNAREAVYDESRYPVMASWVWISEYDYTTSGYIFYNKVGANNSPTQFQYYPMSGTAQASNANTFATSVADVPGPTVTIQPVGTLYAGSTPTISNQIKNNGQTSVQVTDFYLTTSFGPDSFHVASFRSFNLTSSTTKQVNVTIRTPNSPGSGVAIRAFLSWQFYDPYTSHWYSSQTETQSSSITMEAIPGITSLIVSQWMFAVLIPIIAATATLLLFGFRRRRNTQRDSIKQLGRAQTSQGSLEVEEN